MTDMQYVKYRAEEFAWVCNTHYCVVGTPDAAVCQYLDALEPAELTNLFCIPSLPPSVSMIAQCKKIVYSRENYDKFLHYGEHCGMDEEIWPICGDTAIDELFIPMTKDEFVLRIEEIDENMCLENACKKVGDMLHTCLPFRSFSETNTTVTFDSEDKLMFSGYEIANQTRAHRVRLVSSENVCKAAFMIYRRHFKYSTMTRFREKPGDTPENLAEAYLIVVAAENTNAFKLAEIFLDLGVTDENYERLMVIVHHGVQRYRTLVRRWMQKQEKVEDDEKILHEKLVNIVSHMFQLQPDDVQKYCETVGVKKEDIENEVERMKRKREEC